MSRVKNPNRRCRICGGKCEKRMRYCKLCAREVKENRIKNFTAPSGGVPEAQESRRQETKPSPANLEGTR